MRAFHWVLEATQQLLEVGAAFHEIDFRGVDDEQVGGGITEKEVLVGTCDLFDVLEGNLGFLPGGFFGDARTQYFGFGLEIDDEIGSGELGGENFVVALVQLELFIIEIEIGEDPVLFHEEVRDHRAGSFDSESITEMALAFHQEIHLGAKSGAGLFPVKVGKEGIIFAIVDPAGVKALSKDFGERAFPDAERTLNDDETGSLRSASGDGSALGRGGFVGRHSSSYVRPMRGIITESGSVFAPGEIAE